MQYLDVEATISVAVATVDSAIDEACAQAPVSIDAEGQELFVTLLDFHRGRCKESITTILKLLKAQQDGSVDTQLLLALAQWT